jgi:tetratricopeptide (TPR) repeat protein
MHSVTARNQLAWRSAIVPVPARGRARPADGPFGLAGPSGQADDSWAPVIEAMVEWCHAGTGRLWLVEGPSGAGKTRLVSEVAQRMTAQQWPCGWARPGFGAYAVTTAARNGRMSLVLVDAAETRADLVELLRTLANGGSPLPVRVIVLAREFGAWWQALWSGLTDEERAALAPRRAVLGAGQEPPPSPRALALRSLELSTTGSRAEAMQLLATADPGSGAVLLRQAALVVALSTRVGQMGPAEMRAALRDLFEEEEGFWRRAASEVKTKGAPNPALRSALATAAVVGEGGLADAATVLRRVPALAVGAADRLARLALWWQGLYGTDGESNTPTPKLPAWLADQVPDADSDRTGISWTVAALDAERRATSTLAQRALSAHRDIWPGATRPGDETVAQAAQERAQENLRRGVESAAPVDQALAWLTQELSLGDEELDLIGDAISFPGRALSRTAIVLAQRMLSGADTEGDRAAFLLALGARHSELGQWPQARANTQLAVDILRELVSADRAQYLAELAGAVTNLASCLVNLGEREAAVEASYEAVALHREVARTDRDRALPELARALTNLSACLARAGRPPAAVSAAGQAVSLYQELLAINPTAYQHEAAAAERNYQVCREALQAMNRVP